MTRRVGSPFLMRRSGSLYVRVRVPNDLVERVGLVEVRRALGPMRFHEARPLAVQIGTRLKECFVMMRSDEKMTKGDIRSAIRNAWSEGVAEFDRGYRATTSSPWEELREQADMSRDYVAGIERQIATRQFSDEVRQAAAAIASKRGLDAQGAAPDLMNELVGAVARMLAEQQRLFQARIDDSLSEYTPTDPLLEVARFV